MGTPTNHSFSSFFRDLGLEPDDTPSASLDENSSIEESNIFADFSAHSRWISQSNANGASNHVQGRIRASSAGRSVLGPLEEEEDVPGINASHSSVRSTPQDKEANGSCIGPTAQPLPPPPPPPPPPPQIFNEKKNGNSHGPLSQQQAPTAPLKSALKRPSIVANVEENNTTRTTATLATSVVADPSSTTSKTFGALPGNIASETLHTSNMTFAPQGKVGFANGMYSFRNSHDEIDRVAAWAIVIALIMLGGLVVTAGMLSFVVMRKYGLIALLGLMMVVSFVAFLACFVDKTVLAKNPRLRPIRQKIVNVVKATRNLLAEEYHLFLNEYNEHILLLTNGDGVMGMGAENHNTSVGKYSNMSMGEYPMPLPGQRKQKSRVFRVVKPILRLTRKLFHRPRGGTQKQGWSQQPASSSLPLEYHPPPATENAIGAV